MADWPCHPKWLRLLALARADEARTAAIRCGARPGNPALYPGFRLSGHAWRFARPAETR